MPAVKMPVIEQHNPKVGILCGKTTQDQAFVEKPLRIKHDLDPFGSGKLYGKMIDQSYYLHLLR